jgi:hypothetical protein
LEQAIMPGTLEQPHTRFGFTVGATEAIRAVVRELRLLAREHSLASVAAVESGLFRRHRAELRALYLAPRRETGTGTEESEPVRDPPSKG